MGCESLTCVAVILPEILGWMWRETWDLCPIRLDWGIFRSHDLLEQLNGILSYFTVYTTRPL
jgi:hypothetical protein